MPREQNEPVRLTRIYTRGGDAGETSLGDGSRTSKLDPRIRAYGIVDELNSHIGVVLAGSVAGFVALAPIALGFLGPDYFLSRNAIPAFVPLVTVIAGACAAPRVRSLGGVLAAALVAMFALATFTVQTEAQLQRPAWRDVARALGPAPVRRAVIVSDGTTADPLKIYLPGVSWVQPQGRWTVIREIDIVGARKKVALAPSTSSGGDPSLAPIGPPRKASPLPVSKAPSGTRLIARFRVRSWVVARFALDRPLRLNIRRLLVMAPRFLRHTPSSLLVFMQEPQR